MCCSVLELPELPKTKKLREKHVTEVFLPARDPSWLQQKSESINSTKLTPYAQCCSTAFPKMYQLTCITRIFPFSAGTQLSIILSDIKQNYINLVLKWLFAEGLKCLDNTHLNSQALYSLSFLHISILVCSPFPDFYIYLRTVVNFPVKF